MADLTPAAIRVLLVEDNLGDARLMRHMLAESDQSFVITHVTRLEEALKILVPGTFDIILSDLNLPDSAGVNTCETLISYAPYLPVVILTTTEDPDLIMQTAQKGAQDYLVKASVETQVVVRTLRYALERHRAAQVIRSLNESLAEYINQLKETNSQLQQEIQTRTQAEAAVSQERDLLQALMDNIPDGIYFKDRESRYVRVNLAHAKFLGLSLPQQALGKTDFNFHEPEVAELSFVEEQRMMLTRKPIVDHTEFTPTRSGEPRWFSATKVPLFNQAGKVFGLVGVSRNITERKWAERRMEAQNTVTRILSQASNLHEAMARILSTIGQQLEWDMGEFWEVDPTHERLQLVGLWHSPQIDRQEMDDFETFTRQRTFVRGDGFSGRVWAQARPIWMADVMREPGFPPLQFAGRIGLHGGFGFPIQIEDDVLGVITFFSRDIRPPDDALLTMFTSIGGQIGQYIERLRAEAALRASEEKLNYLIRRFVPSAVVEQLTAETHDVVQLGGERHIVSVLFADIRGYTSLTESLEPPALMDLLNSYFGIIGRVILKYGGTINQYAGDMIMATFNVPNPQPDHALRAVQAAQEAQGALRERNAHSNATLAAQFGIGINTGMVVVGYVGFEERFDFATLGETTNLAFRLSSIAEGGQILIGSQTLQEVQTTIKTRPLGPIKLKGRTEPFPVHEVEW